MSIKSRIGAEQALALTEEMGAKAASQKLGVSEKTIYTWRQAKRLAQAPKAQGDLETQNRALKKENEELRQANAILKKAMGFFVKG